MKLFLNNHNCNKEWSGPRQVGESKRLKKNLADSQQERYQVHAENKQQLDALYAKYVVSEHIRGSAKMRRKGDKNLDDAGVKEWLSKY